MPTPTHLIGVKGDECQCGRRNTIRHCTACGSSRVYARMNRAHVFLDGSKKFVETEFRCQSCSHLFIDEERILCEAPPVGAKLAAQKVRALAEAKQSGEFLNDTERKMIDSIEKLAPMPVVELTEEQKREELNKLAWSIRRLWADANIKFKLHQSNDDPGECEAFVATKMKELGHEWPLPSAEQVQIPQQETQ